MMQYEQWIAQRFPPKGPANPNLGVHVGGSGGLRVTSEDTVRRWLKGVFGKSINWIEPRRGSSFGMPDSLVACRGAVFMLEAKQGHRRKNGEVKVGYRPPQHRAMLRLAREGLGCAYIVGETGSIRYWLVLPKVVSSKGVFTPGGLSLESCIELDAREDPNIMCRNLCELADFGWFNG